MSVPAVPELIFYFFCHCMTKMNVATLETLALLVIFVGNVPGERFEIFPAYFAGPVKAWEGKGAASEES